MGLTLNLGFIDQMYSTPPARRRKRGANRVMSTGDVAEILEEKYHPVEHFYQLHEDEILGAVMEDMSASLETMLMGGSTELHLGEATSKIEDAFKTMISTSELETIGYPGVPTQAALKGVNHRLLHPYAKSNPRRPSFKDTSLYMSSFKAWMEE